ncbi:class I SAM-dependent methyltransferase [Candidatus Neomarinimicrobiota bacterium]
MDSYAHKLYLADFLREPVIRRAIQALQLPVGSKGLDAGCGIGSHTFLLAEAVAPSGRVTGLDLSPNLLAQAYEIAKSSNLSAQVTFKKGDINHLPFEENTFDWIWSVDCAGYAPGNPVSLLEELARVVKPGGILAILAWSYQQLLPGYPLLEARLNTTAAGLAPFKKGTTPETHFMRAPGWFHKVGLRETLGQTFVGDVQVPMSDTIRDALVSLFEMRWGGAERELSRKDRVEYQRLCQPASPDFILNLPDYYAFFTYTLFHGKVAL